MPSTTSSAVKCENSSTPSNCASQRLEVHATNTSMPVLVGSMAFTFLEEVDPLSNLSELLSMQICTVTSSPTWMAFGSHVEYPGHTVGSSAALAVHTSSSAAALSNGSHRVASRFASMRAMAQETSKFGRSRAHTSADDDETTAPRGAQGVTGGWVGGGRYQLFTRLEGGVFTITSERVASSFAIRPLRSCDSVIRLVRCALTFRAGGVRIPSETRSRSRQRQRRGRGASCEGPLARCAAYGLRRYGSGLTAVRGANRAAPSAHRSAGSRRGGVCLNSLILLIS
jgi:hypothetical protein